MKKFVSILLSASFFIVSSAVAHETKAEKKPVTIQNPPEALSKYYPPKSMKMELVEIMHALSGSFKGTWIDAKEGQWENALKNAETLEADYKKASDMVGKDWQEKYFKQEAAAKFKEAVAGKSMEQMKAAGKELGQTCETCHRDQYVSVWLKYYWSDFDEFKMEDPITEKKLEFEDYKHELIDSFYTLTNDGKQGDSANAVKAGKEFVQRYKGLKASCMKCHDDEQVKYFYVGGKVEKALDELSAVLGKEPLNMGEVFKSIGVIGKEGCKKCHLTHRWAMIMKGNQE
jgi:cytochrome c556